MIDVARLKGSKDIKFGATVTLLDEDTEEKITYFIVGEDEADLSRGHLSINAPLARALIGKSEKQSVEVKTPRGEKYYEILKIEYL